MSYEEAPAAAPQVKGVVKETPVAPCPGAKVVTWPGGPLWAEMICNVIKKEAATRSSPLDFRRAAKANADSIIKHLDKPDRFMVPI